MDQASRPLTAFTVPGRGLFQWKVMPFGLHSAPATFQRALDRVIGPEMLPLHAFAYLDDIIVIGKTLEEHKNNVKEVFRRLRTANLRINVGKCDFFKKELKYLGHKVTEHGICTDPEKMAAISQLKPPTNLKELRQYLGVASWIPVPDPGVPALPETGTSTPSPSSWSTSGPSLYALAMFLPPRCITTKKLARHYLNSRRQLLTWLRNEVPAAAAIVGMSFCHCSLDKLPACCARRHWTVRARKYRCGQKETAAAVNTYGTLQHYLNKTTNQQQNSKRIPVPDPGVPALPETDTSTPSPSSIATKINKENAIDDKQLMNTGLSNNYTAYGAGKRQLHTETPWEKS
ncbi:hypothetical protein ACLKA6_015888 [Drosophila palustris]